METFSQLDGYKKRMSIEGGYTLYFDNEHTDCVIAIECKRLNSVTYILKSSGKYILSTQLKGSKTLTSSAQLDEIFIIPNIEGIKGSVQVEKKKIMYPGTLIPSCIFQVMECNDTVAKIMNSYGLVYLVPYTKTSGEGEFNGTIDGAYVFSTNALIVKEGDNIRIREY